ncbi:MAG: hypothetical protein V4586_17225 [Pseudomonadota bacterium]
MRGYDVFLIVLTILALFSFGAGDLVIALYFSIIGIPLALLIPLLPALALILGLARILDRLLLAHLLPKSSSGFAGFGVALALLAGVSLIANYRQSAELTALLAGDHDDLTRPLPDQVYGLLSQVPSQECSDFCQRLLLTGQATAVLIAQADAKDTEQPDLETPATLWQIEDQPICPPVALPVGAGRMWIKAAPRDTAPQADLLIGAGIAAGHCLISTASTLAAADEVIVDAMLQEPNWDPGFSFGDDLIAAKRYAVWAKTDQGLAEQARWTYVAARQMFPLAVPIIEPGMNTKTKIGFARTRVTGYAYDPGFDSFAVETLGLRLDLTDVVSPVLSDGEDPLLAALKKPGPLAANIAQLADGRVSAMSRAETATPEDRAVFAALLGDPRITLQWWYEPAARILLRDAPSDFAQSVAKNGFARMNALLLPDQHWETLSTKDYYAVLKRVGGTKKQIGSIGDVLARLPDDALQPYGPAIFALAKDPENRTEPYQLLTRLSAFGDAGARALTDLLLEAVHDERDRQMFRDRRKDAYLAAMIGLCQMGPKATQVLPELLNLVESGKIVLSDGSLGELSAATLIRLGQPDNTLLELTAHQKYPMSTQDLDRAIRRAADSDGCSY